MINTKEKVKISSNNLRSFVDKYNHRRELSRMENVDLDYNQLAERVSYATIKYLKHAEFSAIERRKVFSDIFVQENLVQYINSRFESLIYDYEEKTLEVFDLQSIIEKRLSEYDLQVIDDRVYDYLSRKKPLIIPKDRLKKPFFYFSQWFKLSAGPEMAILLPLEQNRVSPIPIKISAKVTSGTKIQMAAMCLALSNQELITDRFVDLGYGATLVPPEYGILALHNGHEEVVTLEDEWYELHARIGEFLELEEGRAKRKLDNSAEKFNESE